MNADLATPDQSCRLNQKRKNPEDCLLLDFIIQVDNIRRVNKTKSVGQIATFLGEAMVQDTGLSELGSKAVAGLVAEGEIQLHKTH